MFLKVYLLIVFAVGVKAVKLPEHWPLCGKGPMMNDCLKKAVEIAIRDLEKGNRTLGIYPLDPLKVKTFNYHQNSGPVAVRLGARNTTTVGFKRTKVDKVQTDWKTMELVLEAPKITIHGNYFMNGSLIYVPVEGKGKFLLVLQGFSSNVTFRFEKFEKKGKQFFRVKEVHFFPYAKNLHVRFDNLFNGNKILGDRMNEVINTNSELILDTVRPLISKDLGEPMKIISNGLFSRVPVDVIIPK